MSIKSEVLKLRQDSLIDLYDVDLSPTGVNAQFYFTSDIYANYAAIGFQGNAYVAFPMKAEGFEDSSKAPFPKPTLIFSNVSGTISSIMLLNNDLVGAKVIRHRTYVKFIPTGEELKREVYFIERPIEESELSVSFELVNAIELEGLTLPRRFVTRRCNWLYRSADCGYVGNAYFTNQDQSTSDFRQDKCSKTVNGCKLRFGYNAELPHGGFIAIDI